MVAGPGEKERENTCKEGACRWKNRTNTMPRHVGEIPIGDGRQILGAYNIK